MRATELGLIRGPRLLMAGKAISQTGGHGDLRAADSVPVCSCGYTGALSAVVDGPEEMRRAVREQLRQGATQIKLFVSGGVLSPTDSVVDESVHRRRDSRGGRGSRVRGAPMSWRMLTPLKPFCAVSATGCGPSSRHLDGSREVPTPWRMPAPSLCRRSLLLRLYGRTRRVCRRRRSRNWA